MADSNRINHVAIVGAGGRSGSYMAKCLLESGNHTVTALTRPGSTSKFPDGLTVKEIDYDDVSTIVKALKGTDALVITMAGFAPKEQQQKLIEAAAEAEVPFVLPNEWSPDTAHEGLIKEVPAFDSKPSFRESIKKLGKSSYIAVTTGFWYEWSLAIPDAFGIDTVKKTAVFFDDGETKMSISTWPQVGRAVAALLSLPIKPEGGDTDRSLEKYKNSQVYISSFTINQKDMFDSVLRVTGDKVEDWTTTKEPVRERYTKAMDALKGGDRAGFAKAMYSRVFFPDDSGDFEKTKGTINGILGLPKDDLDEATRRAIARAHDNPYA